MLKQARGANNGLAWLLEEQLRKALVVEGRAPVAPLTGLAFYAPDFALRDSEPWLIGSACEFADFAQIPLPPLNHKAEPSSADFARTMEEILMRIETGEFEKVVPMVCEEFEFASELSREMFRAPVLAKQFAYGFEFAGEGLCGVTPEVLFSVENEQLTTMALAGTGPADGPSLKEDQKEMHEHRLVIEHILSELKELGQPEAGETGEKIYGPLKHLHTPIRLKLSRPARFEELVARLHPTAALGGWPRGPAVAWLEKQPFHQSRARFGAPFGFCEGARMLCVVAIRNVQWWGRRLQVSSGCGVVGESQVLKEWKELELKRRAIFRLLEIPL